MKKIDATAMILIIIGALNWGFIGIFQTDFIAKFFENPLIDRWVYIIIGFAGLFKIIYWFTGRWTTKFVDFEN